MFKLVFSFLFGRMGAFFSPLILFYFLCVEDTFFNVSCQRGGHIEKIADTLLIPYQYVLMGRVAIEGEDGSWHFKSRFDYSKNFWVKNIPYCIMAPTSFVLGGSAKVIACISPEVRERYKKLRQPQAVHLHTESYRAMGLFSENPISDEILISQGLPRRPGDEKQLAIETDALRDVAKVLTNAGILWWVDCGTCLGTYRYGGAIPWDYDVDIAILEPDFENVRSLLKQLKPEKYVLVDLSSRDHPMTLLRLLIRDHPHKEIDIYHFRIDPQSKTLSFILSQEDHIFLSKSWKIREQPFKAPVSFKDVFPLKKSYFDGVEVFVPNNIISYLTRIYGENLDPAKKYNPNTDKYEKDLSHPYWQRPFAH